MRVFVKLSETIYFVKIFSSTISDMKSSKICVASFTFFIHYGQTNLYLEVTVQCCI